MRTFIIVETPTQLLIYRENTAKLINTITKPFTILQKMAYEAMTGEKPLEKEEKENNRYRPSAP